MNRSRCDAIEIDKARGGAGAGYPVSPFQPASQVGVNGHSARMLGFQWCQSQLSSSSSSNEEVRCVGGRVGWCAMMMSEIDR